MKYRPDIDGLRALAVLSVMLFHANPHWLPGGFVGVDVFFVISGFVVSASLAASSDRGFPGFFIGFYVRRLARIIPALVVMLVVAALLATLFIPRAWLSSFSEQTAISAFLGFSNWVMQHNADAYFAPQAEFNPYTHTWSLGVEEQFYLICPMLLLLWVRARSNPASRRAVLPVIVLVLLGAASLAATAWATEAQPATAFYSLQCRFWELAAGVALFQLSVTSAAPSTPLSQRLSTLSPWLGLAAAGAGMAFADPTHFPFPWAIPVVVGTLLLIGGAHASETHSIRRFFAGGPAVWIGKRSYSLYLWHWPIFVVMRWTTGLQTLSLQVVALVTTFIAASLSYRLVELPLRHNAKLERFPPALRIAFFLLLAVVGREVAQGVFYRTDAIRLSVVSRNKRDWYVEPRMAFPDVQRRVCAVDVEYKPFGAGRVITYHPQRCLPGPVTITKLTVLGDSHATAYFPIFEELSAEEGVTVSVYTLPGCGFLTLTTSMKVQSTACVAFVRAASDSAVTTGAAGDMVFLPSLRQWRFCNERTCLSSEDLDSLTYGSEGKGDREHAIEEAVSWLRPFADRGMAILFEAPTPIFRTPPFRCSDWFNSGNPVCRGFTQARTYLEYLRAPVVQAMRSIATALPTVHIWDPFPVLCPEADCTPFREGRPLFFDADHLSGYGNSVLFPSFKATLMDPTTAVTVK